MYYNSLDCISASIDLITIFLKFKTNSDISVRVNICGNNDIRLYVEFHPPDIEDRLVLEELTIKYIKHVFNTDIIPIEGEPDVLIFQVHSYPITGDEDDDD